MAFLNGIFKLILIFRYSEKRPSELIVVASLVEKLPNLANLTRTCEVMGISQLVIPTLNVLKHNDYKNVTMTAEKWIPIVECPPSNLIDFIRMKRLGGYTVCFLFNNIRSWHLSKQVVLLN